MAINTNAQNVIIGDSLVDYCTYQESASRYAIPGKKHMGQPMMIPIGEHKKTTSCIIQLVVFLFQLSQYSFSASVSLPKERYSNGVKPVRFLNEAKKCSVDL